MVTIVSQSCMYSDKEGAEPEVTQPLTPVIDCHACCSLVLHRNTARQQLDIAPHVRTWNCCAAAVLTCCVTIALTGPRQLY